MTIGVVVAGINGPPEMFFNSDDPGSPFECLHGNLACWCQPECIQTPAKNYLLVHKSKNNTPEQVARMIAHVDSGDHEAFMAAWPDDDE